MGLASVWTEYGLARNERARGQNSINRRLKSLPNPKDTYNSHIQIQRNIFSKPVRGILIKPVSTRGHSGEDLEILRSFSLQVFINSASRRHSMDSKSGT